MENNQQQSNSRTEYELKHQKKLDEQKQLQRKRTTKRVSKIALAVILVGGGIGALGWYIASRPPIPEGEIISRSGLHWHSELAIFVKGEKQEIPANIGIGAVHNPLHTHDTSGVIHLEFQGLVRKGDLNLSRFFELWGKDFVEFGPSVHMTVNGKDNNELQNYGMKDGDKIELRYE